jgi:hypothetical protein
MCFAGRGGWCRGLCRVVGGMECVSAGCVGVAIMGRRSAGGLWCLCGGWFGGLECGGVGFRRAFWECWWSGRRRIGRCAGEWYARMCAGEAFW